MESFWSGIDAVCIINLDHRHDRWAALVEELRRFVPEEKLCRVSAVYGVELPGYKAHRLFKGCTEEECRFWAGRAGCVLSHARCLQLARDKGWQRVMVLEDDALFLDDLCRSVGRMLARFMQREDWDMIFPGMEPYDDKAVLLDEAHAENGQLVQACRILGPLTTHCYIVSGRAIERLAAALPQQKKVWHWVAMNLSYDSWIANDFGKLPQVFIVGLYPIICTQRESYSDIETETRSIGQGALGEEPFPVTLVSQDAFEVRYGSPRFRMKKAAKIGMHYALGCFYYVAGFRKFKVSVASAGWYGALKAAWADMRNRKKAANHGK